MKKFFRSWSARAVTVVGFVLATALWLGIAVPLEVTVSALLFVWRRITWLFRSLALFGRLFKKCWVHDYAGAQRHLILAGLEEKARQQSGPRL
jgi:hypothetical protein